MPNRKNLPLFALLVLSVVLVSAFLAARPTSAKVELVAGKGEATWFYSLCQPGRPNPAATWTVGLNPLVSNRSSLKIRVENAYPSFQLQCDLHFANSGEVPFKVKEISVYNPNSGDLVLSVTVAPSENGKVISPCRSRPRWGVHPSSLPASCRSKINLALTIGPQVDENSRLDFAVRVRLEENAGALAP
jgi:hypothetical protein